MSHAKSSCMYRWLQSRHVQNGRPNLVFAYRSARSAGLLVHSVSKIERVPFTRLSDYIHYIMYMIHDIQYSMTWFMWPAGSWVAGGARLLLEWLSILMLIVSLQLPQGPALYWATSATFTLAQVSCHINFSLGMTSSMMHQ